MAVNHRLLFLASLMIYSSICIAQTYVQEIRGVVSDAYTGISLPGATVILKSGESSRGVSTDAEGRFRFENIAVGRHSIAISYVGYKPHEISNFSLGTGKEVFFNAKLEESVTQLETYEVKYKVNKQAPINEMAMVSSRMFTIEETERYAGSVGDPARMASNFAGVNSLNDQSNTIVIRGNTPFGMLWMLEGIDIPNPTHFGPMGGTGGAISMLNNNTLNNSDFLTGAFPAQYNNALSGVFDLGLRQGNTNKYEFLGQMAFNGFEAGVEGPVSRKHNASFLANYRYSTMSVLEKFVGLEKVGLDVVPHYRDFSGKAVVYRGKSGIISIFGVGGANHIGLNEDGSNPDIWLHKIVGQEMHLKASSGVAGISHVMNPTSKSRLETILAYTFSTYQFWSDTLTRSNPEPAPQQRHSDSEKSMALSIRHTYKMNPKNIFSSGVYAQPMRFSFVDSVFNTSLAAFRTINNLKGNYTIGKAFFQWKHNFSDGTSLVSGASFMYFSASDKPSLEPRLAFRWGFRPRQSLSFAAGLHSHLAPRLFYVYEHGKLEFTRSLHLVAGYDWMIATETRLKLESYYQHHFNVPVTKDIPGWSLLNYGSDWIDFIVPIENLTNKGTGENYGIELTLEKFLSKGYYYLVTASLYQARYTGYYGIERSSVFNGNFILNALAGKEFTLKKKNVFSLDAKVVWAGSNRYLPFSSQQISEYHHIRIDDWDNAYNQRMKDFFRINLRLGYRINLFKAAHEIALDLYNLTNHKNIFLEYFDPITGETQTYYQFSFLPIVLYRIQF
jgi:hypothetical protein